MRWSSKGEIHPFGFPKKNKNCIIFKNTKNPKKG
jgi:hypothetical protein